MIMKGKFLFDTIIGLTLFSLLFVVETNGEGGILKCPGECEFRPCACCEELMLERCGAANTCHPNGCDQCDNGLNLFKRGYSYYCEYCDEIFGDACISCSDFNGCQQCYDNYNRVQDPISTMYYCKPKNSNEEYTVKNCGIPINETLYPDHGENGTPNENEICNAPTSYPTYPTQSPSPQPSLNPTSRPTPSPTPQPSGNPTPSPTPRPTPRPTNTPSDDPTNDPTPGPTPNPTPGPTPNPTEQPTPSPTPNPSPDPTPLPTPIPTERPTTSPSPSPTPQPTGEPTPGPTPRPTPRPTNTPTVDPTDKPTDSPSPSPTPRPTPNPTPGPTPNPSPVPTPGPTPRPTPRPTALPTVKPTFSHCDLDFDQSVNIVVSNGCDFSSGDMVSCGEFVAFLRGVVEKTYNPDYTNYMNIYLHDVEGSSGVLSGNRDSLLTQIDNISCGSGGQSTDFDSTLTDGLNDLINNADGGNDGTNAERKILMINFCSPLISESDNTCSVPNTVDPDGDSDIEMVIFNTGLTQSELFSCLLPLGTNDPNYIYLPFPEELLMSQIPNIEEEICKRNSPSPTPAPSDDPTYEPTERPSDSPSPDPTPNPTPQPTSGPTPQPTYEPTERPSPSPTPNPSPEPTPYPSDNPTSPPTYRVCDYDGDFSSNVVITVSNGCNGMSSSDCDYLRQYVTALIEQSYPSESGDDIQFTILPHDGTMTDPITGIRDEILAILNDDYYFMCGYGGGTNYDGTTESGLDQLVSSSDDFDQLKLVIISTCSYGDEDENNNTCLAPMNDDPDNLVEITVINLGSDVSDDDQFKCLYDNYGDGTNNYIEEDDISDSSTAGNDAQDASEELCEPRDPVGCPPNLVCPEPCMNDPCDCIESEVQKCIMNTCHPNGCDQCVNGYFKKDYNYPCVSCSDTFGDDCMHCTDFLGCQQCSTGIRTYDPDCELYYCDLGCDDDSSDDSGDSGDSGDSDSSDSDSSDSDSSDSDSSDSDSSDSDSDDSGTVIGGTPSPSRSPTEEPVYYSDSSSSDHETTSSSSEDIDTTSSSSSDTHTTRSSSSDDTATTTRTPETTYPCIDGYLEITSVSDSDYSWAVGVYHYVLDDSTGFEAFVREDSSRVIIGILNNSTFGDSLEYAYIVNTATGDGFAYEHAFFTWSVFGGDEITPEGTFEWTIINSGTDGSLSEDVLEVTLLVYDCDDNLITVPDCTRDCIVVSNFESSYLETTHMFDPSEFEGSYCYMDEYGYYFKDYNEVDGEAFYVLGIDDVEGSTLDNVVLYYENGPFEFDITFDAQWDSDIYGDFACDSISTFFNDNSEGKWYVDPDGSTFEEDSGTVDTSAEMDLTFVNCDGANFLCGDETANSANNLLYNNLNSKLQLFVVIGVSLAMLMFS